MNADPLAKGADEEIVGIPRELALPAGPWTGLRAFSSPEEGEREITRLDGLAQARPRRELELDPSWKQPIPYAVALYRPEGAPASDTQLFWMDRLAGGSDKRLHGRASFEANSGARHLQGCYINREDLESKLRLLDRASSLA